MRHPPLPTRAAAIVVRPRLRTARRAPLMLGTALGAVLSLGYGRGAYGQQVCLGGPPNFTCVGPSSDEQFLDVFGNNLNATALQGFQVVTGDDNGLRFLTTFGNLTFADSTVGSVITASRNGMNLSAEIGSLTVTANGTVTGLQTAGIEARIVDGDETHALTVTTGAASSVTGGEVGMRLRQLGLGELTVTANGRVEGTGLFSYGIDARIVATDNASALTVTTGAGSDIRGLGVGIDARHAGTGAVDVTVNGGVAASGAPLSYGVDVRMTNAANASTLTVTTAATSTITAQFVGLRATHYGSGPLNATVDGIVIASGGSGIGVETRIVNATSAEALTLSTGASSLIQGGQTGINAQHYGLGDLTVTARGTVTGTGAGSTGLSARATNTGSSGTLSVTTAAGSTVSGGLRGITARHSGTGAVGVTVNGTVSASGAASTGVYALAAGLTGAAPLTVTTGAGSSVSGGGLGIYARHSGLGAVEVSVAGTVSATTTLASTGIYALSSNAANAAAMTVTTQAGSSVSAEVSGVVARHAGIGDVTVSVGGTVTGTDSSGATALVASATSQGTLSVTTGAASDVTGFSRGILARHDGLGAITVTANGSVEGTATAGVGLYARASNSANTAALTVTTGATSSITGGLQAISAVHAGEGALGITIDGSAEAGPTGPSAGLYARLDNASNTAAMTITTGAGSTVSGNYTGIDATHLGTGALSVTANGTVTGTVQIGILAVGSVAHGAGEMSVTTGADSTVTGGLDGVFASQDGSGGLSVVANGTVEGTSGRGIVALLGTATTQALTVTTGATSSVTGATFGIDSRHSGAGAHTVTINGMVEGTGAGSRGVYARSSNAANAAAMTVTTGAASQASGGYSGLDARHEGTGALGVTVNGAVDGLEASSDGVLAIAANANTSAMTVTTGAASDISGGNNGLRAFHQGTGALTVTVAGMVEGREAASSGVLARTFTFLNTSTLTVETLAGSSVSGGANGVYALNQSRGALDVSIAGTVEGREATSAGVLARTVSILNAATLTVETLADSSVTGGLHGINAFNLGTGALVVTVDGTVAATETDSIGILAESANPVNAAAITITTGADSSVSGDYYGIYALHGGRGDLTVSVAGMVQGTNYTGIAAEITNAASTGALAVTTAAGSTVTGYEFGITAVQYGLGSLSVTADGTVAGTSAFGVLALIDEFANAGALTVTTGADSAVTGGEMGIYAVHVGLGSVSVTANGTVEGDYQYGIGAGTGSVTSIATVTVTTGADSMVRGGQTGIIAVHFGQGALMVTANGMVEGVSYAGIQGRVYNPASVGLLSITTGAGSAVSGGRYGILAENEGSGETSIAIGQDSAITGTDAGIAAVVMGNGRLTITTAEGSEVGAQVYGIYAVRAGSGELSITTAADSRVSADAFGIVAAHSGTAALTVLAGGVVQGVADAGIDAEITNAASTAALGVIGAAGSRIVGGTDGVLAVHGGLGPLNVLVGGTVEGGTGTGLLARITNDAGTGALVILTDADSAISGGAYGIQAVHDGLGLVGVSVGGTVDSTGGTAVAAQIELATSAADLTVNTLAGSRASGRTDAVYARQIGTGALSVTANGTLIAFEDAGIDAFVGNAGNAAALAVTTGANSRVQGHARGILAVHTGTGALTVSAGAQVAGTALDSEGIDAWIVNPGSSAALSVQTGAGSIVSAGSDGILARHAGTGAVSVSVAGAVIGSSGAAIRTQAAGASGQVITVAATGAAVGISGQAIVAEGAAVTIENFGEISGSVTLTGAADLFDNRGTWVTAGLTSAFGAGDDVVENRGTLLAGTERIGVLSTATALSASAQMTVLQDLDTFVNLGGLIQMQNGFAGDVLEISGRFVADGGVLALDVQVAGTASAADRLVIGGDAQRAGAATGIHVVQTAAAGDRDDDGILLVQVAGSSAADAFTLANPAPLELGAFVYELTLGGCDGAAGSDWYLCATEQPGSIATLYEGAPAVLLGGYAILPSLFERLRQRQPTGEDVEATRGPSVLPGPDSRFGGVWMRLHGERADVAPRISTSGATFRRTNWGLQLGADMLVAEGAGGDWVLGATAQYGRVSATIRNAVGTGQITGQGWGIGFTATWQGLGGTYLDLQGQANRVSVDYATAAQGLLASNVTARTQALSAEVGHRHAVSPSLTLVPQAQLAWGSVEGGSFTDAMGNAVVMGRGSTTSGRIGLAWEYSPSGTGPQAPLVYGILNIRHDFSAPAAVSVAGTPLVSRLHPTQGEIGLGGVLPLSADAVLFGQASYRAPFGSAAGNRAVSASAGLRIRW